MLLVVPEIHVIPNLFIGYFGKFLEDSFRVIPFVVSDVFIGPENERQRRYVDEREVGIDQYRGEMQII
jgi:hypothetical protein